MSCELSVQERIKQLLVNVTENPEIESTINGKTDIINDIGLDSIQMINLVLMLEDEFGIQIDFESFDFTNFYSVDLLDGYISKIMGCSVAS